MQVSHVPIVMVQKDGEDVLTEIIRRSIRTIVGRKSQLLFSWKKENAFLRINTRK